ncbi:odorant receptor 82a-like [Andrena cerasifolii]|uniref:odorant receptor 82a-like n=1 Tax=Andrena cerasifolii TaxID=2819439 RepID=UPI004038426A
MQTFEAHSDSTESLGEACDYERYVNLSIRWNRWLLKPMGLWPKLHNASAIEKFSYWLVRATCYGLMSFLFIPSCLHVILEVEDVYNKLKLFGPLSFCAMAYMKYSLLILHANDIRRCVEGVERDWRHVKHAQDRDIMVAHAIFGRRLMTFCTLFVYGGFVWYYIAVPISVGTVMDEEDNLTYIPMMFPCSRIIADTRYSPINEIFFSIQLVAGALIHGITAAACGLAAAFAVHACGQMAVLGCWLEHLIHGRKDMQENVNGRVASIVSQHVRILKFLAHTEKTLQQISLVEFAGCTLDLCLLGYYIIAEWRNNDFTAAAAYSIILLSLTFNIFIFCYLGELVAERCRQVGEISYMIDWYQLPGKTKLCLIMIMAISKSAMRLTAGNIVKLSLTSFTDVVKTSFGFLNILRTLT